MRSCDCFISYRSDIQPGEMKYNRSVMEDVDGGMDISAVPEISPSLGLVAGRDRLDTVNRSLTKRRPPSFKRDEETMPAKVSLYS